MKRDTELVSLTERYGLPAGAVGPLAALLGSLDADAHAPTTVRAPSEAVDVHLADSLVALELDEVRSARRIADLGAGAGFPGLPLAVALSAAEVVLVESVGRKCAFIRAAADAAGLANVEVVADRAESWSAGIGTRDLVTARALAPLAVLAEYAAPLLREGGVLVAWKGRRDEQEERDAAAAAEQLGLASSRFARCARMPARSIATCTCCARWRPTPERFPRRPGMARKRPLGAKNRPAL